MYLCVSTNFFINTLGLELERLLQNGTLCVCCDNLFVFFIFGKFKINFVIIKTPELLSRFSARIYK